MAWEADILPLDYARKNFLSIDSITTTGLRQIYFTRLQPFSITFY